MMSESCDLANADLFSDEALDNPYPLYRALREAGEAVYSERHDVWVVSRYTPVREALKNWRSFSSAWGTAMDDEVNKLRVGNIISTDPPEHDRLRNVLGPQMSARSVKALQADIEQRAAVLVGAMLEAGGGDVISAVARRIPLDVVADLVGFPDEGRSGLLDGVDASFNTFGPMNERSRASVPKLAGIWHYLDTMATRERLTPGGLGAAIHDAKDRGDINSEQCRSLLFAYATAGIDTTINAIGSLLWLLACDPEQWHLLKADPSLIPSAFNEALRLESPIQAFTRRARGQQMIGSVPVPDKAKVLLLFGSANRDERKWDDPERFDIRRGAADQVAFGYGVHSCAGQFLAKVEGQAVLKAFVEKVSTIQLVRTERKLNNVLRGFRSIEVELA